MEQCEEIRHTLGMKELYSLRKETIERIFGTAKENHGFKYTQMIGKARMDMKVGLTLACLNIKKLAKILERKGLITCPNRIKNHIFSNMFIIQRKMALGFAS